MLTPRWVHSVNSFFASRAWLRRVVFFGADVLPWVMLVLAMVLLTSAQRWRFVFVGLVGATVAYMLQALFDAPRPFVRGEGLDTMASAPHYPSFPSAHVTIAATLTTALFWMHPLLFVLGVVMVFELMFTRVVSGVHDVRDVIAGLLIGIIIGAIFTTFLFGA